MFKAHIAHGHIGAKLVFTSFLKYFIIIKKNR